MCSQWLLVTAKLHRFSEVVLWCSFAITPSQKFRFEFIIIIILYMTRYRQICRYTEKFSIYIKSPLNCIFFLCWRCWISTQNFRPPRFLWFFKLKVIITSCISTYHPHATWFMCHRCPWKWSSHIGRKQPTWPNGTWGRFGNLRGNYSISM